MDRLPIGARRAAARVASARVASARVVSACAVAACVVAASLVLARGALAQSGDPFEALRGAGSIPAAVPARAIATIPERHVGRLVRVTDVLDRIEPPDELSRAVGLTSALAIQIRTRDLGVPVLVQKSDSTITTVLGLRLGGSVEITGVLVERGPRYLFLASDIRPAAAGPAASTGGAGGPGSGRAR